MTVGTPTGRLVTATVAGKSRVTQAIAAGATDLLIVGVSVQEGTAPECSLVGVKLPTAVGASGATTDAFLTWDVKGPTSSVTYPVRISVMEIDTV